jgi:hypothetical protein
MRLSQIIRNLLDPRLLIHPKPTNHIPLLSNALPPFISTLPLRDPLLELFNQSDVPLRTAEMRPKAVAEVVEGGEGERWVEDLEEVGFDGGWGGGSSEGGDDGEVAGCEESDWRMGVWGEEGGVVEVSLKASSYGKQAV